MRGRVPGPGGVSFFGLTVRLKPDKRSPGSSGQESCYLRSRTGTALQRPPVSPVQPVVQDPIRILSRVS